MWVRSKPHPPVGKLATLFAVAVMLFVPDQPSAAKTAAQIFDQFFTKRFVASSCTTSDFSFQIKTSEVIPDPRHLTLTFRPPPSIRRRWAPACTVRPSRPLHFQSEDVQ
jgi:hypothetical protein